jgi:2-polyprenyl-6-methoxyphenol hydroxylase-like FAD-dependent oxidoreductase
MRGLTVARPVLEQAVRDRVQALPNVSIKSGTRVGNLTATDCRSRTPRITGVVLSDQQQVDADLVLDASGRSSQLPRWLEGLGFTPPPEQAVRIDVTYTTRLYKRLDHHLDGGIGLLIAPTPTRPRGAAALAIDADTWIVTYFGLVGNAAPKDHQGFTDYARELPGPQLRDLLGDSAPVSDAVRYRVPSSVRRRYERVRHMPEGCIAIGDGIAAFNPVYGQGMTTAVLEALELGRLLASRANDRHLSRRYFRRISRIVDVAWDMSACGDFRIPGVQGTPTPKMRLANAYLPHVLRAAHRRPDTAAALLRVIHMMSRPETLFAPPVLARALTSR